MSGAPPPTRWTVRPYRPGDETGLVSLFSRVFGREITEEHWRWKLKARPSVSENVWVAADGEKLVFQYAGVPIRMTVLGEERNAIVAVDAMAAPEHRRQGLLTEVGGRAHETWRRCGLALVLGLPNERWGSRKTALRWERLFPLEWLVRPIRPEAILARRLRFAPLRRLGFVGSLAGFFWDRHLGQDASILVREAREAGPEFDALWEHVRPALTLSLRRDRDWVAWRYFAPPDFPYRVLLAERSGVPVGYAAVRISTSRTKDAYIADLFTAPTDGPAIAALLAETLALARMEGAEKLCALAAPGTPNHALLRRAGFFRALGTFHVEAVPLDPALPMSLLKDPRSWCLAGGDFDVV